MERQSIDLKDIITNKDLKNGNLILITGRPAVGKTQTCVELMKQYENEYDCMFFNLEGDSYWFDKKDKRIIFNYNTTVEIIKKVQNDVTEKLKFVFIDYWQLVNDQNDWFLKMLLSMTWTSKLVFVITSQLPRSVESRRDHLPKESDFKGIDLLYKSARKVIVIGRPAMYGSDVKDELKYYVYKDWDNLDILQDKQGKQCPFYCTLK